MDTINSNITPYSKFITLTTAETCLDRETFITWFNTFRVQFQRKFGYKLPYVGIMERQKKRGIKEDNLGSWHIHLAVFIQQKLDLDLLISCWTRGNLNIEKVHSGDIGLYMMKYLSKDNEDIEKNKKVLFKSLNLKEPSVIETMTYFEIPHYHYTASWDFYQGDLDADDVNGVIDLRKWNTCTMYEIHHTKPIPEKFIVQEINFYS